MRFVSAHTRVLTLTRTRTPLLFCSETYVQKERDHLGLKKVTYTHEQIANGDLRVVAEHSVRTQRELFIAQATFSIDKLRVNPNLLSFYLCFSLASLTGTSSRANDASRTAAHARARRQSQAT